MTTAGYMKAAERGFDLYVTEDGINFETIMIDGFGDPYNPSETQLHCSLGAHLLALSATGGASALRPSRGS